MGTPLSGWTDVQGALMFQRGPVGRSPPPTRTDDGQLGPVAGPPLTHKRCLPESPIRRADQSLLGEAALWVHKFP